MHCRSKAACKEGPSSGSYINKSIQIEWKLGCDKKPSSSPSTGVQFTPPKSEKCEFHPMTELKQSIGQ